VASGETELRSNIKLILSQVSQDAPIYTLSSTRTFIPGSLEIPILPPGAAQKTNEQVVLLTRLYSGCRSELQKSFPVLLLSEITTRTAAVIVHALLETGTLSHLEKALADTTRLPTLELRTRVWEAIRAGLQMEAHRFSEEDLTRLEAMREAEVKRIPRPKPPVRRSGGGS